MALLQPPLHQRDLRPRQIVCQHVKSRDVQDLRGVLDREESAIGVFITLEEPSKDMNTEAVSSGYCHSSLWDRDYSRIQIPPVEELLNGKEIEMPPDASSQTFKRTKRVKKKRCYARRLILVLGLRNIPFPKIKQKTTEENFLGGLAIWYPPKACRPATLYLTLRWSTFLIFPSL